MKEKNNILKKFILCFSVLFLFVQSVQAANTSLVGIDVKKNSKDGYNVILKLAGEANIKKMSPNNNSVTLYLASVLPSNSTEIIYDNNSNVNNVIVQKKNGDSTVIIIEGKNVSNAEIFTKNISTGILTPLTDETLFLGVNKKVFTFSIVIMLFWFVCMLCFRKKRKNISMLKTNNIKSNIDIYSKNIPSIAYNKTKNYSSIPKDFVINRYMSEKIRKAG